MVSQLNKYTVQYVTCASTKNMFGETTRVLLFSPPTPVAEQLDSQKDKQYLRPEGRSKRKTQRVNCVILSEEQC